MDIKGQNLKAQLSTLKTVALRFFEKSLFFGRIRIFLNNPKCRLVGWSAVGLSIEKKIGKEENIKNPIFFILFFFYLFEFF